jgi:hypothetical protein
MEIRNQGNDAIVCAHIFPVEDIVIGSKWVGVGGFYVTIESIKDDWVTYSWQENGTPVLHRKDYFSFQCRYCLVL